jgi:hypothetical protein
VENGNQYQTKDACDNTVFQRRDTRLIPCESANTSVTSDTKAVHGIPLSSRYVYIQRLIKGAMLLKQAKNHLRPRFVQLFGEYLAVFGTVAGRA